MKKKQIAIFVTCILLFGACKKKYSCSCQMTVQIYVENPHGPGDFFYDYYNTIQPIKEKLTGKQAKDVCDKTEMSLEVNLKHRFSNSSVGGSCVVK